MGDRSTRTPAARRVASSHQPQKLARAVLEGTLGVEAGDSVTVDTWDETLPWANAFVLECHRIGALPTLLLRDEATFWEAVERRDGSFVGSDNPAELAMLEKTDAYVEFWGPSDVLRESRLPPVVHEQRAASLQRWRAAANRAGVRLAVLYMGRIGRASARLFGMTDNAWRRELVDASLADTITMDRIGRRLATKLRTGSAVVIDHPNGTHLTLGLKGRTPFVFGGILHPADHAEPTSLGRRAGLSETVIPAGYVIVAVDEEKGDGRFVSNVRSELSVGSSEGLEGGVWEFSGGRLTAETYRRGGEYLPPPAHREGPGHDQVSLIDFGLNPRIRTAPWMKDQRLGTVTIGVGANRYFGGTNGSSFRATLHLAGGRVRIDGRTVLEGGRFR